MTNEEALNFAKSTRADGIITAAVKDYSFWECVIEALEKQIQKKPIYPTSKIRSNILCPMCNSLVGDMQVEYGYCPDCGQAIDWRE